jgi:hypothetical protein
MRVCRLWGVKRIADIGMPFEEAPITHDRKSDLHWYTLVICSRFCLIEMVRLVGRGFQCLIPAPSLLQELLLRCKAISYSFEN